MGKGVKKKGLESGDTKSLEFFGTFGSPAFVSIGDPYQKKNLKKNKEEEKKPGFHFAPPKKGKVGEGVFFDNFKPLYEKEKYESPKPFQRSVGLSTATLKKTNGKEKPEKPFLPTSPSKKPSGLGSNYGIIGAPLKYESDGIHKKEQKTKKKEEEKEKKVFKPTHPAKLGGYGFRGLTIGPDQKYESEPFDAMKKKILEDKKEKDSKIIGKEAFKSTSKVLDFFDTQPNVAASKVFTLDKPIPEKKEKKDKKKEKKIEKPFRPTNPAKQGYNCTINKFPEYKNEPFETKKAKKKDEKEEQKPIWKPISVPHSSPTSSILFKNY